MAVDNRTETSHLPAERQTLSDIVEQLMRFDGPPEQFLITLLAVQCHICGAQGGAIVRPGQDGRMEVLSLFPQLPAEATAPVWLAQAVEYAAEALASGRPSLKPLRAPDELYGQPSQQHLIMVPIRGGDQRPRALARSTWTPRIRTCCGSPASGWSSPRAGLASTRCG